MDTNTFGDKVKEFYLANSNSNFNLLLQKEVEVNKELVINYFLFYISRRITQLSKLIITSFICLIFFFRISVDRH